MESFLPPTDLHDLDAYNFGTREPPAKAPGAGAAPKERTAAAKAARRSALFASDGLRQSVNAVVLVHSQRHPHALLLRSTAEGAPRWKLPGGRLRPGESGAEGLARSLGRQLGAGVQPEALELIAEWWCPAEEAAREYPYLPVHVTRPRGSRKLYLVSVAPGVLATVRGAWELVAVPLQDLYGNERFGPVLAALPAQLARCNFNSLALPEEAPS